MPAQKKTLSVEVVVAVRTGGPMFPPVESVVQKESNPQVPLGVAPAPGVPVPLLSQ